MTMGWKATVAKRALLARVPFGETLRAAKRRALGYQISDSNFGSTLHDLSAILALAERHGRPVAGAAVLEIGSGWFPVVPIICMLSGARRVICTDLNRHMDDVTFRVARDTVLRHLPEVSARFGLSDGPALDRVRQASGWRDIGLQYLAPFDPGNVAARSVDLVISRAVLEHVRECALGPLFAALRPKMAAGGVSVHAIDNSDHFEHHDKSLSRINFLTWPERKARLIYWLTQDPENRLRHRQYGEIFRAAGYEVAHDEPDVCPRALEAVPALRDSLAPPFRDMPPEELAAMTSRYVLRPAMI